MADESETQRQINEKRAQDKAAMDQRVKELAEERARKSAEEWRN